MFKKNNNKGFTLMEMLIVVAIIAILIAIAIPTFSSTLEKARESTDAANIRAAYSEAASEAVTSNDADGETRTVEFTQTTAGWANSDLANTVIGTSNEDPDEKATLDDCQGEKGQSVDVTVYADGSVAFEVKTISSGKTGGEEQQ